MSYDNLFRRENSWTISICIVLTKSPNFRCFFAAKLSTVNKNALKAATDASSRYIHKYVTSARFSPHETYGSVSFRSFSCSHADPNSVSCGCWPYFSEIRLLRRPGMAEVQGPANCQRRRSGASLLQRYRVSMLHKFRATSPRTVSKFALFSTSTCENEGFIRWEIPLRLNWNLISSLPRET